MTFEPYRFNDTATSAELRAEAEWDALRWWVRLWRIWRGR